MNNLLISWTHISYDLNWVEKHLVYLLPLCHLLQILLYWRLSTEDNFVPTRKNLIMSEDIFSCHNRVGRCYWHLVVETKCSAKYPTMYRTAAHNKELPSSNVNYAKGEKPCSSWSFFSLSFFLSLVCLSF